MRIDLIAGARPNFMEIAPIIDVIKVNPEATHRLSFRLIHTDQHCSAFLQLCGNVFAKQG